MIGDEVVITVVDIRGDKVRLGVEAPKEVPVHRKEVYEAIKRESAKATAEKVGVPVELVERLGQPIESIQIIELHLSNADPIITDDISEPAVVESGDGTGDSGSGAVSG